VSKIEHHGVINMYMNAGRYGEDDYEDFIYDMKFTEGLLVDVKRVNID